MTRLALLCSALLLSACSSTPTVDVKKTDNPEEIYNQALSYIDRERFIEAAEDINEIRHRFPQSRFAALAELRSADMDFKQENFTEAAAEYGTFLELYPNHSDAPYALYQKALSYYNDAPSKVARDQGPANDAAKAADQLIHRYPTSTFAEKSKELFGKARMKLAEKEAYIAHYYERQDAKVAAHRRWAGILINFSDLKDVPEAKALMAEAEKKAQELAPAEDTAPDRAASTGASP